MTARLPLARFARTHTRSLDEMRALYGRLHTPIALESKGRAAVEWRSHQALLGPIAVAANRYGGELHAWTDATGDAFSLTLPSPSARGTIATGLTSVELGAGRAAVITSPGQRGDVRLTAGFRSFQLVIPRATVDSALVSLDRRPGRAPLSFEPHVAIDRGSGAVLARLVRYLVDTLDRDPALLAAPLVVARLVDALVFQLLLGQPHDHPALSRAVDRATEPERVRRVAEYLEAHAAQPVQVAELAAIAGVSVRAIQAGFLRHRGCSPTEFLRARRLELARTRLLDATDATVTETALACGFEHLGRFAAYYRTRFAESPADTMRRAQAERSLLVQRRR